MTPYNLETTVFIDPNIKPEKLTFGKVSVRLYKKIGTIIERKYVSAMRTETYKVRFEGQTDKEAVWFVETELVTVYRK